MAALVPNHRASARSQAGRNGRTAGSAEEGMYVKTAASCDRIPQCTVQCRAGQCSKVRRNPAMAVSTSRPCRTYVLAHCNLHRLGQLLLFSLGLRPDRRSWTGLHGYMTTHYCMCACTTYCMCACTTHIVCSMCLCMYIMCVCMYVSNVRVCIYQIVCSMCTHRTQGWLSLGTGRCSRGGGCPL